MAESSRWYCKDGTLAPDEVIGKTTGKPRRVTLKDAKENGWVPSVSTIKDILRKPGLDAYFLEQTLRAVMRHPGVLTAIGGVPEEEWAKFKAEVELMSEEHRNAAADAGTAVHAYIQRKIEGKEAPEIDLALIQTAEAMYDAAHRGGRGDLTRAKTEATFVRVDLGYAGTPDIVCPGPVVIDWKTQGKPAKKMEKRDDWAIQLGAYSYGLFDKAVPGFIVCGSTVMPGEVKVYEYTVDQVEEGWEQFDLIRRLWLRTRMPEYFAERKAA